MSETRQFILFGREVCPLCDLAAELLDNAGIAWIERDIDDDIELLVRYRDRIPVLRDVQSDRELDWPFSREQLLEFSSVRESNSS